MDGWEEGRRERQSVPSERDTGLPPASPRKSHTEVVVEEEEEEVGGGDPSPLKPRTAGLRLTCCGYACSSSSSSSIRRLAG